MDRRTLIEKNRLDLAYHRNAQLVNAILIFGTTGVLTFVGTFIWKPELLKEGLLVTIIILVVAFILYTKLDAKLKSISEQMDKLKD